MRKISVIFAFLLITGFLACQKESKPADSDSLSGKWKFNYSVGGFTGNDTIWPPPDTILVLILNANNTYSSTSNGVTLQQGQYTVFTDTTFYGPTPQLLIRFDDDVSITLIVSHNEPFLVLSDPHTEPYGRVFTRVK